MHYAEEVKGEGWTACVSKFWKSHPYGVLRGSCQSLVGRLRAVTTELVGLVRSAYKTSGKRLAVIELREIVYESSGTCHKQFGPATTVR
jgi:hypothetical protein